MKRIAGTFVLLAGLSGCVTITTPSAQGDRKVPGVTAAPMSSSLAPPPGAIPQPSYPNWTADPGHGYARVSPPAPPPQAPAPAPAPAALPPTVMARASEMPGLPPGMPTASTPRREKETRANSGARAVSYASIDPRMPEIISPSTGSKPASARPAPSMKEPPATAMKEPPATTMKEPPVASEPLAPAVAPPAPMADAANRAPTGNGPLFRLVNTKRITLNFEVKDVGSSGLAAVDLWYTQDGKEWKKHEAPTNAQAYVVEVDEEGMYGFTLVARSGIGLGNEPPQAGDQPQVWVVVDLTAPEVQLGEVTASVQGKTQHVSFKWQAVDKNLGRQPVTLSYAEKPEGPWKVLAANLDASGTYKWQVPEGMPPRVLIRVEAADMAGNVGQVVSSKPIVLDCAKPTVKIVNVEPNGGR